MQIRRKKAEQERAGTWDSGPGGLAQADRVACMGVDTQEGAREPVGVRGTAYTNMRNTQLLHPEQTPLLSHSEALPKHIRQPEAWGFGFFFGLHSSSPNSYPPVGFSTKVFSLELLVRFTGTTGVDTGRPGTFSRWNLIRSTYVIANKNHRVVTVCPYFVVLNQGQCFPPEGTLHNLWRHFWLS